MNGYVNKRPFVFHDQIQLVINNQNVLIDKAQSKSIYGELISGLVTPPTAQLRQLRYNERFDNVCLEWEQIYSLPFKVALDTKLREFQYKVLNRYLVKNTFLKKIGKIDSSACSFCGVNDESLEHLFVTCLFTATLWEKLVIWITICCRYNIWRLAKEGGLSAIESYHSHS